ncbi:MAG TPA: methyltransferase domain-containing protein [Gammaproteobacteria bacterium]|nr:methyltransferase domain-containing protein [Gammaproteobacteria bacterium]
MTDADTETLEHAPRAQAPAFDALAPAYDASFGATALGRALRALVWQGLDEAFAGCRRVLELGCGTGDDALHLASRGVAVLATDASSAMLRAAAAKAEAAGHAGRVTFRCLPMERLGGVLAGERFDGVLSNFGAVNCAGDVGRVAADVAELLVPGAPLVWVVMGKHVPWEWAWFLARGEGRKAFRRSRSGGVAWRGLQISYPTPAELERALRPHFAPVSRRPLGAALPPTYASGWLERSPRAFAALLRLERSLHRRQALAVLADHYIFEARRTDTRRTARAAADA